MYILAIETTGTVGSVALIDSEKNIIEKRVDEPMSHLKKIIPMAGELLSEAKINPRDLTGIGVSVGPGSFTGIRIGVSTARMLCQALNIKGIAVTSLEPFAKYGKTQNSPIAPIIYARRMQVYGAVFSENGEVLLKEGAYMLKDVMDFCKEKKIDPVFFCDGAEEYGEALRENGFFNIAPPEIRHLSASMTALCALEKYMGGELLNFNMIQPNYMRETEAEQKLKSGKLAAEREEKLKRLREMAR